MNALKTVIATMLASIIGGNPWALAIILLISAITEVGIPTLFAIDTILLVVGFQLGFFSIKLILIIIALLMGRLAGSSVIFWLSETFGKRFLNWLGKYQPRICNQLNLVAGRLNNQAPLPVALARLTPGLLTAASVASGLVRIKYRYFALGVVFSSLMADFSLLFLGFFAKTGASVFGIKPETWQIAVGALVFLTIGWGVYFIIQGRRTKKQSNRTTGGKPIT